MLARLLTVAAVAVAALALTPVSAGSHLFQPHTQVASKHHHPYETLNLPIEPGVGAAPYNLTEGAYVLGLSSGGFLAVQFLVAFSSEFAGAGIFAAGPYWCAQGSIDGALLTCVEALEPINLPQLESTASLLSSLGLIDNLKNLTNTPVYLFHGTSDRTVFAPVNNALYQQMLDYGTNVFYNNGTDANHAWISPLGPNPCTVSSAPFISNCDFDAENELLTHMLQRQINTAAATPTGNIYAFSQDQYAESLFGTAASTYSMDTTGYVYLPAACASNKVGCALLVVLHGCEQGYYAIQGQLIQDSYLNQYADTNNLVILYPQAIASALMSNPEGCWDWWGFSAPSSQTLYATHGAPQMEIIRAVMRGLGFNGTKPIFAY